MSGEIRYSVMLMTLPWEKGCWNDPHVRYPCKIIRTSFLECAHNITFKDLFEHANACSTQTTHSNTGQTQRVKHAYETS